MKLDEEELLDGICKKFSKMEGEKAPWLVPYEWVCEYVCHLKDSFLRKFTPIDEILNRYIFDGHAAMALQLMSSTFVSNLWPNGARSIKLSPHPAFTAKYGNNQNIQQYFEFMNRTIWSHMDNPKAGLITALDDYMYEQGAYGTSGIFTFDNDDYDLPVVYKVANIKDAFVDVDNYGLIDTVYFERHMTLKQMAQEYGIDSLTEEQQELLADRNENDYNEASGDKQISVVIAIEPNGFYNPMDDINTSFPYSSTHVDIKNRKILRRSGYTSLPVHMCRFYRRHSHKYGFSPAFNAIPDIFEINALRECIIALPEKFVRPPLAVWDSSILGGGTIDLSAGAINVFSPSGYIPESSNRKPVEQLIDVRDPQFIFTRITELTAIIEAHFYKPMLIDLQSMARVTNDASESQDKMRSKALGTIFARQMQEVFVPMSERTVSILFKKGLLGTVQGSQQDALLQSNGIMPTYIPQEVMQAIQQGTEFYTVDFVSPAARILQNEQLEGITNTLQMATQLAQAVPAVLDNINMDTAFAELARLNGCPTEIINSPEVVTQTRQQRSMQQAAQMKMQAMVEGAKAQKDNAAAQKMNQGG